MIQRTPNCAYCGKISPGKHTHTFQYREISAHPSVRWCASCRFQDDAYFLAARLPKSGFLAKKADLVMEIDARGAGRVCRNITKRPKTALMGEIDLLKYEIKTLQKKIYRLEKERV